MLYDVSLALRRFRKLIKFTARKYSCRGNFRLGIEEIEAEGYLTLVQCCRSFPDGQRRFGWYFKRAWNNRLRKLIRYGFQQKRQGIEVDLELAFDIPVETEAVASDFWERMTDQATDIMPLLSDDSRRLLQLLIKPSEEVVEYAWRDFCRKNRLHAQGVHAPGWRYFRVKPRHIRGVLHMNWGQMQKAMREIRSSHYVLKNRTGGNV